MSAFSKLKVATRLYLGFGIAVALGLAIAIFATIEMRSLAASLNEVSTNRMVKSDQFGELRDNLQTIGRYARNILIHPEPAFAEGELAKIAELRAANSKIMAELEKTVTLAKAKDLLQIIKDTRGPYNKQLDEVIALARAGKATEAREMLLGPVRAKQNILFKAALDSKELQFEIAKKLAEEGTQTAGRDATLMLALATVMLLIGGFVAWAITRGLSQALGAEPGEVAEAVQHVADGDLTQSVSVKPGDTASVMAAVARMQHSLKSTVANVRNGADSVATASSQIAQGNLDLSQRTEQQASALEETASAMEQLGSTVKNNADNAKQANQLAMSASSVAVKGGEVVGQVVGTMKDINDSSKKIADIISVIDGIAFQTNILALNAAVEAARAGEQGRGFAVVAGEVRNLAQRSADAAKEIKELITASVDRVEQGTQLVDQAGQTMEEVVSSIRRVTDIVAEISSASAEQAQGVSQVGEAVASMDQTTQQNAALVEQSAAAADSLRNQAQALVQTMSAFKVS